MNKKKASALLEKIRHYSTGYATVGTITNIVDGDFVDFFVGKVRGMIVSNKQGAYKFKTREEARRCGVAFRESCRADLSNIGGVA